MEAQINSLIFRNDNRLVKAENTFGVKVKNFNEI